MATRIEQIRSRDSTLPVEDEGFVIVRSEAIKETSFLTDLYNLSVSLFSSIFKSGKGFVLTQKQLDLVNRIIIIEDEPEEPPRASVANEPVIPINHEAALQFRNRWLQKRSQTRNTSHVPPAPPVPNFRYDYQTNIKLKVRRPEDGLTKVHVEIINSPIAISHVPLAPPPPNFRYDHRTNIKLKVRHPEDALAKVSSETPQPIVHDTAQDSSHVSEAGPASQEPTTFLGQIIKVLSHKLESKPSILDFTSLILEKFIPSNDLVLSLSHNEHDNTIEFEITLKDNYKGLVSSKPDVPKGIDWVILYPSKKMKLQIYIYQDELIIFFNSEYPFSVSMLQNIPIWGPTYLPKIACNSARITDTHTYVKIFGGKELKNSFNSFKNNYDQIRWEKDS